MASAEEGRMNSSKPSTDGNARAFQVRRHSGRRDGVWRVVIDTDDAEKARMVYEQASIALRQGTVEFVRHGTIANSTSAPRLRSRW
jgi:hypothetical protein